LHRILPRVAGSDDSILIRKSEVSMGHGEKEVGPETWTALREAWASYRTAVESWIEVAETGSSELDRRIHGLIEEHNAWSETLGRVVDATHHH
jgi:hypothetical protein